MVESIGMALGLLNLPLNMITVFSHIVMPMQTSTLGTVAVVRYKIVPAQIDTG